MNYVMCFVKCVMLDMGVDVVCVMWEEHKSSELYFSIIEMIFKKSVHSVTFNEGEIFFFGTDFFWRNSLLDVVVG